MTVKKLFSWRLNAFLDGLNCVLRHNGDESGSISIAHSMKAEIYKRVIRVLNLISYAQHERIKCRSEDGCSSLAHRIGARTIHALFACETVDK